MRKQFECVFPLCLTVIVFAFAAGCGASADDATKTYGFGENVAAGAFGFQVTGCEWRDRIGSGQDARTPVHRFLVLHLGVFNRSGSELAIPPLTLLDDEGNTHPEATGMTGDPKWLGLTHKVRPNETAQGHVIFDVSPGHYRLRVTDESGYGSFALIDVPLRLQTDLEAGGRAIE